MKSTADALERLAQMSKSDRDWLLQRLSSGARQRLLDQAATERGSAPGLADAGRLPTDRGAPKPLPAAMDAAALEAVEGALLAGILADEPPWMIALLLRQRTWSWESELLARLPPVKRFEVSDLRRSAPHPSGALTELLMKSLRERVAAASLPADGFERLLYSARTSHARGLRVRERP
jgi:hypothetical protein